MIEHNVNACAQALPESVYSTCCQPDKLIDGRQPFCAWEESCRVGIHKLDDYHQTWIGRLELAEFLQVWLLSHIVDKDG